MTTIRNLFCILTAVLALMFPSCGSNPAAPIDSSTLPPTGVYVVNEGNFQRGNSSLTFYSADSNKAYQNVFTVANGRDLGDTGNDIVIFGSKAFIVVNGSQKIEVISTSNNKSIGTLQLPASRSPYGIVVLSDARAYVTNLMDSTVTSFNPSTLQIEFDRVKVGANPMGIATANGKMYVCNSGFGNDSTVTVLNAGTGTLIKTIGVGASPSEVGIGPNGEVIVKSDGKSDYGNSANDTPGQIAVINSDNDVIMIKAILPLQTYGHPGHMTISGKGYGYFVGKTGIIKFVFSASTLNVDGNAFATLQAYHLAIDDATDQLYATDPKDYSQPGEVVVFDSKGAEVRRFAAGIIPGAIAFKR